MSAAAARFPFRSPFRFQRYVIQCCDAMPGENLPRPQETAQENGKCQEKGKDTNHGIIRSNSEEGKCSGNKNDTDDENMHANGRNGNGITGKGKEEKSGNGPSEDQKKRKSELSPGKTGNGPSKDQKKRRSELSPGKTGNDISLESILASSFPHGKLPDNLDIREELKRILE